MRPLRWLAAALSLIAAAALGAQQLDIYDPDDFVDPHQLRGRAIFISRFVAGAARGYLDQYRREGQDVRFVHLANSIYWHDFQLDYKHSELRGENGSPPKDAPCCCASGGVAALACGPVHGEAVAPASPDSDPVPGAKDLLQLSWYQTVGSRGSIRYRLVRARQYALPETAAHVAGLEDHDDTSSAQLDFGFRSDVRTFSASLGYTELTRHSTLDQRKQKLLTVAVFLPLVGIGPALLTPHLQLARISGPGSDRNVVNPSLDLSWALPRAGVNLHAVYSPAFGRLGIGGNVHHQIALYADRGFLFVLRGRR